MLKILLCAGAGAALYKLGHAAGRLDNRLAALQLAARTVADHLAGGPFCRHCGQPFGRHDDDCPEGR